MIAYEDLVSALALWREQNGLPIGSADYLGSPPPPSPVSFESEAAASASDELRDELRDEPSAEIDLELSADDAIIDESAEGDGLEAAYGASAEAAYGEEDAAEVNFGETIDPYGEALADGSMDAELAIGAADAAIIDEAVAASPPPPPPPSSSAGPDEVTAPVDYDDDDDGGEVAFISSGVPAELDVPSPAEAALEAEADFSEYPPLDATAQGIAPAPPVGTSSTDMTLDHDDYPSVASDDPTVEGFRPIADSDAADDEGGDGSGKPPA